ncbi:MAG: trimethylamine methyltransferase family protein [Bacillota bacterium]
MRANHVFFERPRFQVLSPEQMREIHLATLEVLERTGVKVLPEEGRQLLADAGARLCPNNVVKIPAWLVEETIRWAPRRIVVSRRDGTRTMFLEDHKAYFGGVSSCPKVMDPFTGEVRPTTSSDVKNLAVLHDYLPNMDFLMLLGHVYDVPSQISFQVEFREVVKGTRSSPLVSCNDPVLFDEIVEMASMVAGGMDALRTNPFLIIYTEPISPLVHADGLAVALKAAGLGLPVVNISMPIGGATAPVTFAGNLVVANAESLSAIVIQQLKRKGAPSIYGAIPAPIDMATTIYPYGAPELHLMCAALTDMAHYYGVPMYGTAGCTDAKAVDAQAGLELGVSVLMSALSGANLVHDVGLIDHADVASFEAHVLTDEIVGYVDQILCGVQITPESMALDVIDQVGHGNHYLGHDHTFRHFRRIWRPRFLDRSRREIWEAAGSPSVFQRLNDEVKRILTTHTPSPLDDKLVAELDGLQAKWLERTTK